MIYTRAEISKIVGAVRALICAVDNRPDLLVPVACVTHCVEKILPAEQSAQFLRNRSFVKFIWDEACRA